MLELLTIVESPSLHPLLLTPYSNHIPTIFFYLFLSIRFSHFCCIDPEGKYEALEKYGNDLTELARRGKLDPVIGRDDEIRRCIQILSRRTKNNPVIIGEPGVGKTAIAEGYDLK